MATAQTPGPYSELSAINRMLLAIGEAPVNALTEDDDIGDVGNARRILEDISREVCEYGWRFNWDYEVPFSPNVGGEIVIPQDQYAQVSISARTGNGRHYKLRFDSIDETTKVYDWKLRTYEITETIYLDVSDYVPYDRMPPHIRDYVCKKAAQEFQVFTLGAKSLTEATISDTLDARARCEQAEIEIDNPVMHGDLTSFQIAERGGGVLYHTWS